MELLKCLLESNKKFCANPPVDYAREDATESKFPRRKLAIVTCMDTRLVDFLEPALGIGRGDAKVIKNAGNCVTGVFDNTIRSLLICIFELDVREILVVGHYECGMEHTRANGLIDKMLIRGVAPEAVAMVQQELAMWVDSFHDAEQNMRETVEKIRINPLIPSDIPVHGLMFHPHSGLVDKIVNGYACCLDKG